jgi:archaellin
MMKNNKNIQKDEIGSIGIGAMIVFIALILVAAVASAVIIQTGEKLQQNAQQTGSDTQQEISGKITINSIFVFGNANAYLVYFESSPGSEILDETTVRYQMTCEDTAGPTYQYVAGTFTLATQVDDVGGAALGAANDIDPGSNYAIILDASAVGATVGDCSATNVGVNGEVTLWIHVDGGGSTYETLYIFDISEGALVI